MQSKKHVNNPELPVFNIRKVNKKAVAPYKGIDLNFKYEGDQQFTQLNNYSSVKRVIDTRKQKQILLDQSVNEAIINSKMYTDLKKKYLQSKKKNAEYKKMLEQQLQAKKKEKLEALQERQKLEAQKQKSIQSIHAMKEKLQGLRQSNQRYRQALNNRANGQAQYISNLIMSMRFQAEYQHNIDPDQMTYEQLLQLQQKIGVVSKGLPPELIDMLPKLQVKQNSSQQDKCTVCFSSYEIGQIITRIFNCKHEFHFECLQGWLNKQKICPNCKQEVEFENL